MTLRERLRKVVASQDELDADDERAHAGRQVGCTPVDQLDNRSRASVSGVIRSTTLRPREGVPAVEAELFDGTGTLDLVWLGRRGIAGVDPGRRMRIEGLVCLVDGRKTVFNPRYELRPRPGE